MMNKKRIFYWIFLAILFFINVFILIHRNDGYKYFPYKTYSQLYVTDSTLYLQDLTFNADTVALQFSRKLTSAIYKLIVDDSITNKTVLPVNNSLRFFLKTDVHTYTLIPADNLEPTIFIQIDHDKSSAPQNINELIYCSIPGPQIEVSPYQMYNRN